MVWAPAGQPPAAGWPVIYLLDGNSVFGMVTDIIRSRSGRPEVTGIRPAVVVALGYPTDQAYDMTRRIYDLTPPAESLSLPRRPNNQPWPPTGGAAELLDFIQGQVKPFVAQRWAVDARDQTLIGHSFGGLFTLYTLLNRPDAFTTYVAGSPSLWFNQAMLITQADAFQQQHKAVVGPNKRVMLGVGGDEDRMTPREQALPNAAQRTKWKLENQMISNLDRMAALLGQTTGIEVAYQVFPGQDHGSVVPLYLNAGLIFALAPENAP
jgi:predicted alpha/beta superfamily hydrolase